MRAWSCPLALLALFASTALFAADPAPDDAKPYHPNTNPMAINPDRDAKLPQDDQFIVHEWGTFTSFAGSDGVSLDFRPLVDVDLPAFVVDRQKQAFIAERREVAYRTGLSLKGLVISRQRMETPVTYFYTDQERIVDVRVDFPRGLLTEFYPPVRQFGPAFKKDQLDPLENSFLGWGKIRLIPQEVATSPTGVDPFIPTVKKSEGEHYAYARETDSAHIQITDPAMSSLYREKFLFYRGAGNFELPVSLKARGDGRFTLVNSGKTPLRYAFLVNVAGGAVRFARYDDVVATTAMALPEPPSTLDALAGEMVKALVSDGLFEKEAVAMVKTWRSSWFGEEGTRVLYSLPQAETDALLPLKIQPAPKEVKRVMIARLETLTPEQESRIESLVSRLGADDPAVRDATAAEIKRLGRFAEPALNRVVATTADPETKTKARGLLRSILVGKDIPTDAK